MVVVLRKYVLAIHRLVGLLVGAVFLMSGITGAILVFDHKLDELLNPALLLSQGRGPHRPLDDIMAEACYQDLSNKPIQLRFPRTSGGVDLVYLRPVEGDGSIERYVDPYTATMLGERMWGTYTISFIYRLHYTLLGGKPGKVVLGICGAFFLISLISGLQLGLPRRFVSFARILRIRDSRELVIQCLDWHKLIGLVSAIAIMALVVSGMCMLFPQYVKPALSIESPADVYSELNTESNHLSLNKACAIAEERFPTYELRRIYLPQNRQAPIGIMMTRSGAIQRAIVWMDQYSGKLLQTQDPENMGTGEIIYGWIFPIHSGRAFGIIGRIIVLLAGISATALSLSGVVIWWLKRRRLQRDGQGRSMV
jgi:uncharacterized iron-regulated membrane protein